MVDAGGKGSVAEVVVGCHFPAVGVEQHQHGVVQRIQQDLDTIVRAGLEGYREVVERAFGGQSACQDLAYLSGCGGCNVRWFVVAGGILSHRPQQYRAVPAGTGQGPPIRAECHAVDPQCMTALQGVLEETSGRVPQANGQSIVTGQGSPVGTECHAIDPVPMAFQGMLEGTRGHVP